MTHDFSVFTMVAQSGQVVQGVLLILAISSCFSWFVFFKKSKDLQKMQENNALFLKKFHIMSNLNDIYEQAKSMEWTPFAHMYCSGHEELIKLTHKMGNSKPKEHLYAHLAQFGLGNLERALKKGINECNKELNTLLPLLASVGPLSPFIGLFGTVWGILRSFQGLSSGDVGLEVVAPGIAEALVATGIGLVVAIPAVFFYNQLIHKKAKMNTDMDSFAQDFLNVVERSVINTPAGPQQATT